MRILASHSVLFSQENDWILPNQQLPAIRSTWYPNEEQFSGLLQIEVFFEGEKQTGQLLVTPDHRACFIYDSGPRCFDVYRNGDTYLLTGTSEFKVNEIVPGKAQCSAGG